MWATESDRPPCPRSASRYPQSPSSTDPKYDDRTPSDGFEYVLSEPLVFLLTPCLLNDLGYSSRAHGLAQVDLVAGQFPAHHALRQLLAAIAHAQGGLGDLRVPEELFVEFRFGDFVYEL